MSHRDVVTDTSERPRAAEALDVLVRSDASALLIDDRLADPSDPRLWPNVLGRKLSEAGARAVVENGAMEGLTAIELREWSRDPLWIPTSTNALVLCIGGNVGLAPAPGLLPIPPAFRAPVVRQMLARTRFRQALARLKSGRRVVFVEPPLRGRRVLDLAPSLRGVVKELETVATEFGLPIVRLPQFGKALSAGDHEIIAERVSDVLRRELAAGTIPQRDAPPSPNAPLIIVRSDSMALGSDLGRPNLNRPELWPHVMRGELESLGTETRVLNMSYSLHDIQLELRGFKRDRVVRRALSSADLVLIHLGAANWYPRGRPDWMSTVMSAIRPASLQRTAENAYRVIRPTVMKLSRGKFRQGSPEQIKREYDELIASLKTGPRRVALMIPFPGETPRSPLWRQNMDELEAVVRELGKKYEVPVLDGGAPLRDLDWETLTYDGVHLNPSAHEMVGRHMARLLVDSKLI